MDAIGICGDNCAFCARYIANKSGRITQLQKVRDLWVRLGLREPGFPAEEMACGGCLPENNCAYAELRACVAAKSIENCGLCAEYPCQIMSSVFQKTDDFKYRAEKVCSQAEMEMLNKAFFSKKAYFDRIQQRGQK